MLLFILLDECLCCPSPCFLYACMLSLFLVHTHCDFYGELKILIKTILMLRLTSKVWNQIKLLLYCGSFICACYFCLSNLATFLLNIRELFVDYFLICHVW